MQRAGRYGSLDAIRGLAALGVMVFHYNHAVLGVAPFGTMLEPVYEAGFYLVDLFFVLSGYLLATIYAGNRKFFALAWRRIARLAPLHWASLIAMTGLYVLMADAKIPAPDANADFYHFALNILLLNSVGLQHGFSFNAPSWSISVEWVVNLMLFAIIVCGVKRLLWPALVLVVVSLALLLQYRGQLSYSIGLVLGFLDAGLLRGILGFFIGVALATLLPIPRTLGSGRWMLWDMAFIFSAGAMLLCMQSEAFRAARGLDFLLPVVMMPVLIAASLRGRIVNRALSIAPLRLFGEISYSIYLLHFPMMLLLTVVAARLGIVMENSSLLRFSIYVMATLGISWLSWRFFEVPMQSWLNRWWRLGRGTPPGIAASASATAPPAGPSGP